MESFKDELGKILFKVQGDTSDFAQELNVAEGIEEILQAIKDRWVEEIEYDKDAGIFKGPFEDCGCPSHHQHSAGGERSCPICTNYNTAIRELKERLGI